MYSARRCLQAAKLALRRRCSSLVLRWGGSHGAPAVWLGAKGTYPICPILRRRYLASLSLSRFIRHFRENAGKGVSRFQPGADIVNPISC